MPYAARDWLDRWEQETRQHLDGVVTDTVALAQLLVATGPVGLRSGDQVAGADVVQLTGWDAYQRFDHQVETREGYPASIAPVGSAELLRGQVDCMALLRAPVRGGDQGRTPGSSAHEPERQLLVAVGLSGELPLTNAPLVSVIVNKAAGNKLATSSSGT